MARVLICLETQTLADIHGRARALARALQERGHEVALAVSDTNAACRELRGTGLAFYQAPIALTSRRSSRMRNYGDSLAALGFFDLQVLRRLQDAWRQLMTVLRPDVLVIDHAPVAHLAARLNRFPYLRLSDGFDTPPASSPLPVLQPWLVQEAHIQCNEEAGMLHNVNQLLQEAGVPSLVQLHQLFAAEHTLFATTASFDPFGPRQNARYAGWLREPAPAGPGDWPGYARRRVFLHLRSNALAKPIVKALNAKRTAMAMVLPGCSREALAEYAIEPWRSSTSNLEGLPYLCGADLAVFDGDPAVLASCLQAGVPAVCVPDQVEGFYLASALVRERLGMAVGTVAGNFHGRFRSAVRKILEGPGYRRRMLRFALTSAGTEDPVAVLAEAVEVLIPDTAAIQGRK